MTNEQRRKATQLAQEFLAKSDPTGWFEALYTAAEGDANRIPWADREPNPALVEWLDREQPGGKTALVIGCGLGDDAEEIARRGFEVTAFDVSPTAITWCGQRWPDSSVKYLVADLFNLPASWKQAFDLVIEIYTVQALPLYLRRQAIEAVTAPVGGHLLVIGRLVNDDAERPNQPWPLTRAELAWFSETLTEACLEVFTDQQGVDRFRAEYTHQS